MLFWFFSVAGRFFAAVPAVVPALLCRALGMGAFLLSAKHRRRALSNLHHAFPEKTDAWRRRVCVESFSRMAEMGLFVMASPYFGERRLRRMFTADKSLTVGASRLAEKGTPSVILVPHFSLMEALTRVRVICPEFPKWLDVGVFYRPFGNPAVERWVRRSRERFGIRMLSRRAGFGAAMGILREKGAAAVLFDQKTGGPGALSLFMGRLASSSELAGLLAEKYGARCVAFYAERTGFWRGILRSEFVHEGADAGAVTIAANLWLEKKLRLDDNHCADWLWAHRRWQTQDKPPRRFRLWQKRNLLAENIAALGLTECPRNERFWFLMPDAPEDLAPAVQLVRELRLSRPDAAVTLLADAKFTAALERERVAEAVLATPERPSQRRRFFKKLRREWPDTCVVFPETEERAREAALTRAPQRFGICRDGRKRKGLTHCWEAPPGVTDKADLWRRWFESHGLPPRNTPADAQKSA
ncbi:MAG: hypothetical protein LBR12_05475 [Opitutaceae bacterium]|nr:hypothetical protein [Opitutaceae bacterium]